MPNSIAIGVAYKDQEISGGTVDNTVIGGTTAAAGTFTSATASTLQSTGDLIVRSATVAATGTDNTNAAAISGGFTLVTGSDGTKGVILPNHAAGTIIIIKNQDNAVLKVYPDSGAAINQLTATTGSYNMAARTPAIFIAQSTTQWFTLPLLAS